MKFLLRMKLVLMILLAPAFSLAMTCFEPQSGLLVSVQKEKDQIQFRFSSGKGYEFIPQFEGPLSLFDLKMMKFQAESLKEIGSGFEIAIPISACELKTAEQGIFSCYREVALPGTTLTASSLTAYRTIQKHVSGDFEIQNFRMLIGQGDRFFFAVPFALKNCSGSI